MVKTAEHATLALLEAERDAGAIATEVTARVVQAREELTQAVESAHASRFVLDGPELEAFLRRPYIVMPAGKDQWRVVVPRWVKMHVGILERATEGYNVFLVNRFARWLGNIPKELDRLFEFRDTLPAVVRDGAIEVADARHQEAAFDRYRDHVTQREGDRRLRVREGHEFQLLVDMLDDGILPFVPKPVQAEHRRSVPAWRRPDGNLAGKPVATGRVELREYQVDAWREFEKLGAVGIYWPTGAGKTYPPLYAFAHLKGPHLLVVPGKALAAQWHERVRKHLDGAAAAQVTIVTYAGFQGLRRTMERDRIKQFTLTVYDECHALPATTFSKFATVPTHYRMGLSATPYREDGRTDYIFALTGYPIGLDWKTLMDLGVVEPPDVRVHVVKDRSAKLARLEALLMDGKRTLVFCDSIEMGEDLARYFGIPFVNGSTRDRLDVVRNAKQVVVSRVLDEGISLPDLERTIEYDFLYGSRRQEGQRMGRLMHADERGEHVVLMTTEEKERYGKRLLAIEEKGIRIRIVQEAE